jgi:hypothetical protein
MRANSLSKSLEALHPEHMNKTVMENNIASLQMIVGFDRFGPEIQKLAAEKLDMLMQHGVERDAKQEQVEINKKANAMSDNVKGYSSCITHLTDQLQAALENGLDTVEIDNTRFVYDRCAGEWTIDYEQS